MLGEGGGDRGGRGGRGPGRDGGRGPGRGGGGGRGRGGRGIPPPLTAAQQRLIERYRQSFGGDSENSQGFSTRVAGYGSFDHLLQRHQGRENAERFYQSEGPGRDFPPSHFTDLRPAEIADLLVSTVQRGRGRVGRRGEVFFHHSHQRGIGHTWHGQAPPRTGRPLPTGVPIGAYHPTQEMTVVFEPDGLGRREHGLRTAYPERMGTLARHFPQIDEEEEEPEEEEGEIGVPDQSGISADGFTQVVRARRRRPRREGPPEDRRDMGDRFGGGRGPGRGGPPPPPPTAPQQLVIAARGGSIRSPRPSAKRTQDDKMQQFFDDLMAGQKKKRY